MFFRKIMACLSEVNKLYNPQIVYCWAHSICKALTQSPQQKHQQPDGITVKESSNQSYSSFTLWGPAIQPYFGLRAFLLLSANVSHIVQINKYLHTSAAESKFKGGWFKDSLLQLDIMCGVFFSLGRNHWRSNIESKNMRMKGRSITEGGGITEFLARKALGHICNCKKTQSLQFSSQNPSPASGYLSRTEFLLWRLQV